MAIHIELGAGNLIIVKAGTEDTAGAYTLLEYTCMPGAGSGAHIHSRETEALYVVSGALTMQFGDREPFAMHAGDTVHIKQGQKHGFINHGTSAAVVIIVAIPAGLDRYFIELGQALHHSNTETKISALNKRYGITFF